MERGSRCGRFDELWYWLARGDLGSTVTGTEDFVGFDGLGSTLK